MSSGRKLCDVDKPFRLDCRVDPRFKSRLIENPA